MAHIIFERKGFKNESSDARNYRSRSHRHHLRFIPHRYRDGT